MTSPAYGDAAGAPSLSVVTASRGRPRLLEAKAEAMALGSLPADRFEWCLWLNETPGRTREVERRLGELGLPYEVRLDGGVAHPAGRARNLAAARARGSILLLSDDDCVHDSGALEAHLALHRALPNAVGIGPLRLPETLRRGRRREPFERPARLGRRASWINLTGANSSLPAEAYRAVGGYDDEWLGYGGEDPELALRLRARGLRFRHVPGAGAEHHGRVLDDADKAYRAGWAHQRVVERHPASGAAWALGVHPVLLSAKHAALLGPWARLVDPDVRRYECAYARGARDARRTSGPVPDRGEERP